MIKKDWITIPNLLSYFRIILIPFFVYYFIQSSVPSYIPASILFLSGLTDAVDGKIARIFDQITELGKALDPIADKLTQLAIVICLVLRWNFIIYLLLLLLAKETSMFIFDLVLLKKGKKLEGAKWFGKISTIVFYLSTFILVLFPDMETNLVYNIVIIVGGFLLLSFVLYTKLFIQMLKNEGE
ncbi:CDP-alcohol phosphatidyltransferase family protein [Lacticigenium naphthae]|uniref:CDP-alcohol phosphatidyltransferase family protein n=1 Tax=Lacticigenium naphthae TaxID=515351 RepID=UPI00040847C0|nr:CDP-alcohol phosphatidyltransferase family protein [Lacticigenium naphthae]